MSRTLSVCVVEDDPTAAELLEDYISGDGLSISSHYLSAEDALAQIPLLPLPDAVLMDVGLPGMQGTEATKRLKERYPNLEILMLTTFEDTETIVDSIKAGASGYMLKASSSEEIRNAIFEVCRGGSFLTGSVARKLLSEFQTDQESPVRSSGELETLTEREQVILNRLVLGESYKIIAAELAISVHTVNNHIRHIYRKLHVNSRAEAVAKALGVNR
ncbi:MAG: response regulator transcription factor [Pseudomonadales bacterium]